VLAATPRGFEYVANDGVLDEPPPLEHAASSAEAVARRVRTREMRIEFGFMPLEFCQGPAFWGKRA